ncbi:MAG: lysylphosphatidylglycerol synthase transmembrane domain-containing protein [Candidatus Bathyarchaeia archaeon]
MASAKPKITWKTLIMLLVGIIAFVLYLFILRVDIPEIIAKIQNVNMPLYLLAASLIFVEMFLYSLAWHSLLSFLSVKLSVLKSYLYVWYGNFMDIIIPAESISGEISRAYLITREQGNSVSGKVAASLVAHRLIGMSVGAATIGTGTIMLLMAPVNPLIFNLSVFVTAATIFFILLLVILCVKINWTLKIIDRLIKIIEFVGKGRWKSRLAKAKEDAFKIVGMFHDSMKEYARAPKVVLTSILLSAFSWLSYLAICYIVFLALGFDKPPLDMISIIFVTQSITTAIKSIPIGIPFEVGLPEITMTTLYVVFGIPFDVSATATILTRILSLWMKFFVGFAIQQWVEISAIKASLKAAKTDKG